MFTSYHSRNLMHLHKKGREREREREKRFYEHLESYDRIKNQLIRLPCYCIVITAMICIWYIGYTQ